MKILIINSDSPNNRGDRAILQGNITLVRERWPNAEIWALSEYHDRDEAWYGIRFLPYSAYTANPLELIKIAWFSRTCDYVLWGGGEILKDYTNRLGILYWYLRMLLLWFFNRNIYGAFQGIGPTNAWSSKRLIVAAINLTRLFLVRDHESKEKLESWGAKTPVVSSFDPAVMNEAAPLDPSTIQLLQEAYDITPEFLDNAVGVGLRRWFHYKKSGWVPYKFRFWESKKQTTNPKLDTYTENTAKLLDQLIETHDVNIVFFPMFNAPSEGDDQFSRAVASRMKHGNRTRMISDDSLSPQQYLNVTARCKLFIAARLHSSIVATSAAVPAVVFYYVDKGRLYFEQIGMSRFSQPIESLLATAYLPTVHAQIADILKNRPAIQQELTANIQKMRQSLRTDFARIPERTHEK